ncbi:MAG: hypothetical protein ACMUIG_04660 [Thermoplasmatota archaeon]
MKKRRGKQPVKPNVGEAMKERLISLKGSQFSTMNIPIIYRRTFGWYDDSVIFKPINKRSFVVYSPEIRHEEMRTSEYVHRILDISSLPWYSKNRVSAEKGMSSNVEELQEMLVSLSLTDRYVNIDIPKPEDPDLDICLREDLEGLAGELGYVYSSGPDNYRCTFIFPKHSNEQIVKLSAELLGGTISVLQDFTESVFDLGLEQSRRKLDDIRYSVNMNEVRMDSLYTQSLNVLWDLPQVEMAGHFLIIQACERAFDEIQYVVDTSYRLSDSLSCSDDDIEILLWDEFVSLWRTSLSPSLSVLRESLDLIEKGGDDLSGSLDIIRRHRLEKETRSNPQRNFQIELTRKIERKASNTGELEVEIFSRASCIEAIELLFGINQAAERIRNLSQVIATKVLYLRNSVCD